MFTFFASRRQGGTQIVKNKDEFFLGVERSAINRSVFDAQGEAHADIDLRLVEKIEELIIPKLGRWEQSDRWFHQMDCYGDGVRSLVFRRDLFPGEDVPKLQALLEGEHSQFSLICCVTDSLNGDTELPDDYLAIWQNQVLATRTLADRLPSCA